MMTFFVTFACKCSFLVIIINIVVVVVIIIIIIIVSSFLYGALSIHLYALYKQTAKQ